MRCAPLPPDEAHIWYALPATLSDPRLLDAYRSLLTPEENERRLRYRFEKHRHEYLVTRALARTVLSRYTGVEPRAWRFEAGSHGKPEIASPSIDIPLRFNLSNAIGMVVCLVAAGREVGVDVEALDRAAQSIQIADSFFSPTEVSCLRALPREAQERRFIEYWTLKESYIKARGLGLSIPLDHFSFLLDRGRPPAIAFDPRLEDDPGAWQFARFVPARGYMVAGAVRRRAGDSVRFVVRKTVPLIL